MPGLAASRQTFAPMEESEKDNVVLIGMPGAGKSTLGVVLAKILQFDFVDADILIQREYGASLREIIENEGAAGFIEREAEVLKGLAPSHTVIATGGSAVYSEEAMAHLHGIGHVVYLKAEEDDLKERLGSLVERGVVLRGGVSMSIDDLYSERMPLYDRHGEIVVSTSGIGATEGAYQAAELLAPLLGLATGESGEGVLAPMPL